MAADLLDAYPELAAAIGALCPGQRWALAGVSALVVDAEAYYLELTKPKHWRRRADGATVVGLGGIGGSLEPGETVLGCLAREMNEELGRSATVAAAQHCFLVYEERQIVPVALPPREYPTPALFTVSANLYRRDELAAEVLAIATFWARLGGPPLLGDLYGLLRVPFAALPALLARDEWPASDLAAIVGLSITAVTPLPSGAVLRPVWTMRSVQLLLRAGGSLTPPLPPA